MRDEHAKGRGCRLTIIGTGNAPQPDCSSVAAVALTWLRLRLGFPLPILGKRTTNGVRFLEIAYARAVPPAWLLDFPYSRYKVGTTTMFRKVDVTSPHKITIAMGV